MHGKSVHAVLQESWITQHLQREEGEVEVEVEVESERLKYRRSTGQ